MADGWDVADIPDQTGRVAIVTGANSGLGLVTARELARAGARVVLACRNLDKGHAAVGQIRAAVPEAQLQLEELDLASLASVRGFSERFNATHDGLELLINNAGVMGTPRRRTADGFELQFGTNHLGHFALTTALLETMEGREDARVVTLSSTAHKMGRINFDNLNGDRHYFRWNAYGQSKLANLLFALELDRRLRAAGSTVKSLAAHPGYAATNLQSAGPPLFDIAESSLGPVDIVVNNASGWIGDTFRVSDKDDLDRDVAPITADTFDRVMAVDGRASALMIGEFARRLAGRGGAWGRIVGLTSGGSSGFPGEVTYGAAKAAQVNYTMSAATELAELGVTANIVHPPVTDTGWVNDGVREFVARSQELTHVATPDEVAVVIGWLCTDEARLVSGTVLQLR